ncbi:MAG: class I SAM-dependent methyltransferase [Deltaproteobacteria bacterium]|nr:MAG: class I SAM-dependent methyltransferase [Deltaproteobacteria bacterium]
MTANRCTALLVGVMTLGAALASAASDEATSHRSFADVQQWVSVSTAVGATGTVFSADTEPELVRHLRERAEKERTDNVVPILASPDNPRLPRGAVDLVLLVDTFHHIDHRVAYFGRLRGTLASGGRVAVVDWQKRETPVGPELEHRLAREQVVEEMRAAGYALVAEPDVLPYQYCLVFRPR